MVDILKSFHKKAVTREKSRLVPLNAFPAGRSTAFAIFGIENLSVITVGEIKPVSTILLIVLNPSICFISSSQTSVSLNKYA